MLGKWLSRVYKLNWQRVRKGHVIHWQKRATVALGLEQLEDRTVPSVASAIEVFDASPALFVENEGQWEDASVRYAFFGTGANVLHTDSGPVFQLFQQETDDGTETPSSAHLLADPSHEPERTTIRQAHFSATFDGAQTIEPIGLEQSEAVHNYYVGEQTRWRSAVPSYETVAYLGVYDGIDLFTWGQRNSLKYEFHVEPGADYHQIQVSYRGIESLSLDDAGALHIQTELGELVDDAPYVYQEIDGSRVEVPGQFVLVDADTYSFHVTGDYDTNIELIIDPIIMWSTYLGGAGNDFGNGVAVDGSGNLLVTGRTYSSGWISGGSDTSYNGNADAFVAKLSPTGSHLWSTYLGGSSDDFAEDIAVDGSGDLVITGGTSSAGWTSGGFDTSHNGSIDAFVAKLSPTGSHLWSTYLGGTADDFANDIAVDASGNPIVTGQTQSGEWTSGGFDTSFNGGTWDAFAVKLSSAGNHLWSTYLGGSNPDYGWGVDVDGSNNPIISGQTASSGWTSGGFDTSYNGGIDGFVAKFSPTGSHLWSTYLGGTSSEAGESIAVDGPGDLFITGGTSSAGWTSGGFDTSFNGGTWDIHVVKLSSTGSHLWSTYLGGTGDDAGFTVDVDGSGNPVVAGFTSSSGWTSGGFDTSHNGDFDAFVAKLSSAGSHLWSTYVGGPDYDCGEDIVVGGSGNLFITGCTQSSSWTSGGFDITHNGGDDAFLVKICEPGPDNVGVHRPSTGMWYLDYDGNRQWSLPVDRYFRFGIVGDEPVVGDWDGDGLDEVGVHRGDRWYLDYDGNRQWNPLVDRYFRFGIAGDEPLVGDWDGDGVDEVGVRRGHMWYLDVDGSQNWNISGDTYFVFGVTGDEPVVGDWNGDGVDEVGVHRPSTGMWYLDYDGNHQWNIPGDVYFRFGVPGDDPVVGDWNDDGVDEVGVHRGHMWYLDTDGSHGWNNPGDTCFAFGADGDVPVVGRWQAGGGAQASFASASPALPAEAETTLIAGLLSTNTAAGTGATRIDSVFAAESTALSSAAESDTELLMDATPGQVNRPSRLGSGGLLDLRASKAHDQALKDFLQSTWWL